MASDISLAALNSRGRRIAWRGLGQVIAAIVGRTGWQNNSLARGFILKLA
jgi:hypothetical protein